MHELRPLLDLIAMTGIDIVELDPDKPAVFTIYCREPDGCIRDHKAIVTRLGGDLDRATSMFHPRYFEIICHTCSDVELLMTKHIDEIVDPSTGEILTVEQVAARLPVGRFIPAR